MSIFDSIATPLRGKKPAGADALAALLAQAGADLTAARNRLADLENARTDALLGGEAARAQHRAAVAAARDDVADLELALAEIQHRLSTAESEAAEARRVKDYEAAKAARDAAAATLAREYPAALKTLVNLLRAIAEADAAVDAANENLPFGAEPLAPVEVVARDKPGLPANVISEHIVDLWALPLADRPLSPEQQQRVEPDTDNPETGTLLVRGGVGPTTVERVIRRPFVERKVLPAQPGEVGPRLARMSLPALKAGMPDHWSAPTFSLSPASIIARLNAAQAEKPAPFRDDRAPVVTLTPAPVKTLAVAAE